MPNIDAIQIIRGLIKPDIVVITPQAHTRTNPINTKSHFNFVFSIQSDPTKPSTLTVMSMKRRATNPPEESNHVNRSYLIR